MKFWKWLEAKPDFKWTMPKVMGVVGVALLACVLVLVVWLGLVAAVIHIAPPVGRVLAPVWEWLDEHPIVLGVLIGIGLSFSWSQTWKKWDKEHQ